MKKSYYHEIKESRSAKKHEGQFENGGIIMQYDLPIGIFDSGIGGLTVYKKVKELLPGENIIYFGDTARAPYGSRSKEEIYAFSDEIMRLMALCSIKLGVVACNTITVLGTEKLCANYNFDLIGNSNGAKTALAASKNKRIGVIATEMTIKSGAHARAILELDPEAKVFPAATPQLAPLVEGGRLKGETVRKVLCESLAELKNAAVDTLILGCTHYPYLLAELREVLGPKVALIDPAQETAFSVKAYLQEHCLLRREAEGESKFYFSATPKKARSLAENLFDVRSLDFSRLDLAPLEKYYLKNFRAKCAG